MPDEQMDKYGSFEEFIDAFSFRDSAEVYSNGVMLIPVFRVKQWMRHMERQQGKKTEDRPFCDLMDCKDCRKDCKVE